MCVSYPSMGRIWVGEGLLNWQPEFSTTENGDAVTVAKAGCHREEGEATSRQLSRALLTDLVTWLFA